LSAAAGLLQGIHSVMAMARGPHWLLSDPDAKAYGLALSNALRHLPVTMAQKYIDFTALGIAVIAYEGPRVHMDMQLRAQRGAAGRPRRDRPRCSSSRHGRHSSRRSRPTARPRRNRQRLTCR